MDPDNTVEQANQQLLHDLSTYLMMMMTREAGPISVNDSRIEDRVWDLFWFLQPEEPTAPEVNAEHDLEFKNYLEKCIRVS